MLLRLIRDYLIKNDFDKISQIIDQLCKSFSTVNTSSNVRNGGLIGLAAAAIALGDKVSTYLNIIVQPILNCFSDNDSRIRYFACESMYNIAKVSRSEMLVYFRQIFDALNRVLSFIYLFIILFSYSFFFSCQQIRKFPLKMVQSY